MWLKYTEKTNRNGSNERSNDSYVIKLKPNRLHSARNTQLMLYPDRGIWLRQVSGDFVFLMAFIDRFGITQIYITIRVAKCSNVTNRH